MKSPATWAIDSIRPPDDSTWVPTEDIRHQRDLNDLKVHTAAALNGLKQQQDVDRVVTQLQNSIVGTESMSMYIRLEQQNSLEYLSNMLSIAQQGRLPPQLHQQLQQILQPYQQNRQAVQFGKYPVTVQQVTRSGQIYLRVQLTTTRPMQWTMYRVHPFPLFLDSGNYRLQLPFRYFLLHHQLREYIPLDPEEALACQQGMCHPAQPRHQVRDGHCIIQILLGQNYTLENCPYQPDYQETALVSTAGGIAYSVKQPLLAYIHCLQDEFKQEILKRIRISNWGWTVTNPGCYLETPKRQTHPQPFNASQIDLSYHNHEQTRGSSPCTPPAVPAGCSDAGLIVGVIALVITIALTAFTAHTTYKHHVQAANLQKFETAIGQSDADKFREYRALEDQVRFATEIITVNYQHSPRTHQLHPSPDHDTEPTSQDGPEVLERCESFKHRHTRDNIHPSWATSFHRTPSAITNLWPRYTATHNSNSKCHRTSPTPPSRPPTCICPESPFLFKVPRP